MVFYLPPDTPGEIVAGLGEKPGLYAATDPGTPSLVAAIAGYFGKSEVRVCQPWQTARSWIIGGMLIPAFPDPSALPGAASERVGGVSAGSDAREARRGPGGRG